MARPAFKRFLVTTPHVVDASGGRTPATSGTGKLTIDGTCHLPRHYNASVVLLSQGLP